jgi:PilZ domain
MLNPLEEILKERRAHERHNCTRIVPLTILVRPKMQRYQIVPTDISQTGLSFLLNAPIQVGAVFAIQRHVLIPGQSWVRSGKVTHCSARGDQWQLGCELTPPFSEEELAVFLAPMAETV